MSEKEKSIIVEDLEKSQKPGELKFYFESDLSGFSPGLLEAFIAALAKPEEEIIVENDNDGQGRAIVLIKGKMAELNRLGNLIHSRAWEKDPEIMQKIALYLVQKRTAGIS